MKNKNKLKQINFSKGMFNCDSFNRFISLIEVIKKNFQGIETLLQSGKFSLAPVYNISEFEDTWKAETDTTMKCQQTFISFVDVISCYKGERVSFLIKKTKSYMRRLKFQWNLRVTQVYFICCFFPETITKYLKLVK